jgi:hypothetical protein
MMVPRYRGVSAIEGAARRLVGNQARAAPDMMYFFNSPPVIKKFRIGPIFELDPLLMTIALLRPHVVNWNTHVISGRIQPVGRIIRIRWGHLAGVRVYSR